MVRFDCVSGSLSLSALRKHRAIWVTLVASVVVHVSLTSWDRASQEARVAKPLTTQFVKHRPRLTKPLELKKRPEPRRRHMQREVVSVKARSEGRMGPVVHGAEGFVQSLARPQVSLRREAGFAEAESGPRVLAEAIAGGKEAESSVNMSLEMVDLNALDTGKYHAMVIQDPKEKRNVRGFFHLAIVHIMSLAEIARGNVNRADAGVARLIQAVNEYTDITADIRYRCDLGSQELFKTPWVYAGTARLVELTENELRNLGKYLVNGGFFFAEEWIHVAYNSFEGSTKTFTHMYEGALASQGYVFEKDWRFDPLPGGHPIFHCFFDFEGIPAGYSPGAMSRYPGYSQSGLEGVTLGNRLLGTFNHRCLVPAWYGKGWGSPGDTAEMPQQTRALEFGVNTIVFALTQEGSITHRAMEWVE